MAFREVNSRAGIFVPADFIAQAGDLGDSTYEDVVSGATIPTGRGAIFRLTVGGSVFVHIGTAAPSDDDSVRLVRINQAALGLIPAGQGVWVKRQGTTDVRGSIEVWYA